MKPNILWITTDQQQQGTLDEDSKCLLPNLKKLAKRGVSFTRAYAPMPVCCPVRAMWVSGAYPWHNGVFTQVHSDPSITRDMYENTVTYSSILKEEGYKLGFVGKWHASNKRSPVDFGFDEVSYLQGYPPEKTDKIDHKKVREKSPKGKNIYFNGVKQFKWPGSAPFWMWGYMDGPVEELNTTYIANGAIDMINDYSKQKKPWHIAVHFPEPHDPYSPHKKYLDMYDDIEINTPKSFCDDFDNKPGMHKRESQIWGDMTKEDVKEGRKYYYAYCTQIDEQIGRIIEELKKTRQENNTIIAFTSDHGDMLGAHKMWIKSWMPYEEVWKVPMIVVLPESDKKGVKSSNLVQTHWLTHTFLDLVDAKKLPYKDGISLKPLLENPLRQDWDNELLCVGYGCEFYVTQRILVTKRYKYVFNGFDFDEMYDLKNDPNEMKNVIDDIKYKEEKSNMRKKLYDIMNKYCDPYGDRNGKSSRYGASRYLLRE